MRISIATPCFNSASSIEKTIQSVIKAKQCNEIEYIIIDGASTDGTLDIINKYSDCIDIIVSEKDNGIYDAFNKCIKTATGDYVLILAADDYLLDGAIERFIHSVKAETEIWVGSVVIYYEGYYQYMFSEKDLSMLHYCCSLRHPATFFKRDSYDKYGYYNSELKISGDREIFLRMYEKGGIFQIEDIPVVYFSMDGISNKKLESQAIPEEKLISKQYGLMSNEINHFYKKGFKRKIMDLLKLISVKTHTYHILCRITGRGRKFISKRELIKLGIDI